MAAGATTCQTCEAPLVASYKDYGAACIPVCDKQETSSLPSYGYNVIYKNGQACDAEACPTGTVASPNNECFAAQNGNLCVAVSDTSSTTCKTKADFSMNNNTEKAGWGGAVLRLEWSDTSDAVCSTGVKQLAAWLTGRSTWMGFDLTQYGSRDSSYNALGLQWQAMGTLNRSNLRSHARCGNALGGLGPQRALTHGNGIILGECMLMLQRTVQCLQESDDVCRSMTMLLFVVVNANNLHELRHWQCLGHSCVWAVQWCSETAGLVNG
jgi:hypothetical protein